VENVSLPAVDRFYAVEEGKGIVPSVYDMSAQNSDWRQAASGTAK